MATLATESYSIHLESMYPLTAGDYAVGQASKIGVEAAYNNRDLWLNVGKTTTSINFFDDKSDPKRGVLGAYKAIVDRGAVAILGALNRYDSSHPMAR